MAFYLDKIYSLDNPDIEKNVTFLELDKINYPETNCDI